MAHLPAGMPLDDPLLVWLWSSATGLASENVDLRWQAFLWTFDLERSKPQCCHTCGSASSSWVPSSLRIIVVCWWS
ncbi:hypothetical protein ACI2L5_04440, partial [Streptomyces milbemycinicus]